jgi:hypothetical protein
MHLVEEIQQHVAQLPSDLQAKVFEYILTLEHKHKQITEDEALAIHEQLMSQYAEAFEKLSQ